MPRTKHAIISSIKEKPLSALIAFSFGEIVFMVVFPGICGFRLSVFISMSLRWLTLMSRCERAPED